MIRAVFFPIPFFRASRGGLAFIAPQQEKDLTFYFIFKGRLNILLSHAICIKMINKVCLPPSSTHSELLRRQIQSVLFRSKRRRNGAALKDHHLNLNHLFSPLLEPSAAPVQQLRSVEWVQLNIKKPSELQAVKE